MFYDKDDKESFNKVKKHLEENIKKQDQFFFLNSDDFITIYMFIYEKDYFNQSSSTAITLNPHALETTNGWNFSGKIQEDYYSWINEFKATKNDYHISGNMENTLIGNSKEALIEFVLDNLDHIEIWDYMDI